MQFYGGAVESGVTAAERPPLAGVPWANAACPVLFINVDAQEQRASGGGGGDGGSSSTTTSSSSGRSGGSEKQQGSERQQGAQGGGASYCNPGEAEVAMKALARMLQDASLQSAALLSPYRWVRG